MMALMMSYNIKHQTPRAGYYPLLKRAPGYKKQARKRRFLFAFLKMNE